MGWRNFFFQLCCCVSFWFWREIGFGLHTYILRVPYSCGVVSVFWFWREIVFSTYVLTIQLWCCVIFFWFWREIVFGITYVLSVQYSCAVVFLKNDYPFSLFLEKQLSIQYMFLIKSELSITTYLFLVLYKSTSL